MWGGDTPWINKGFQTIATTTTTTTTTTSATTVTGASENAKLFNILTSKRI